MEVVYTIKQNSLRVIRGIEIWLDSESKKLFRNSSWVFFGNLFFVSGVFIQSVILGRVFGVELYGTYLFIIYFVETIQEFFNLNVSGALIKFVSEYKSANDGEKIVAFVKGSLIFAGISGITSVIAVTSIMAIAYDIFIKQSGLAIYIIGYAAGRSLTVLDPISSSLLLVYNKFKLNSTLHVFSSLLELTFIILSIVLFPRRISTLIIAVISAKAIGSIFNYGVVAWVFRDKWKRLFCTKMNIIRGQWKEIREFVLSQSGIRTLKVLISRGDVVLLGMLAGAVQVGYYGVAKKIAFSILLFTDPLYVSVYPQLSSLVSKQRFNEIKIMLRKISKILILPMTLFLTLAVLFNKSIISFVYGNEYITAGKPFVFLLLAVCVAAFFFWLAPLILSLGLAFFKLKVDTFVYIIGTGLAFVLTPFYGANGVAIAVLAINILSHSIFLFKVKQYL